MPKKSVREMTDAERRRYSLSARVFNATLMSSFVLGIIALLLGIGLYSYVMLDRYIDQAYTIASSAASVINRVVDVEKVSSDVMDVYRSLDEQELAEMGTDAYFNRYIDARRSSDARMALSILKSFAASDDVSDVYIAMYDRETHAIVYMVDPDDSEETGCQTGYWEDVTDKEIDTFLGGTGGEKPHFIENRERYGLLCKSAYPVKGLKGQTVALVMADVTVAEFRSGLRNFIFSFSLAMIAAILIIAYFMTGHMKKTLVDPVNAIASAAEQYVSDKRSGADAGDHFSTLGIRTGDEVENLSLVMADMERDLNAYEEDLGNAIAEKERMGVELSLANRIQESMLPHIFPPFPNRTDIDVYASMTPAKEVGGDFYDFFLLDDDHLAMVIADVSGKGIPAALFMMGTKILIKNYTMNGLGPADVLRKVNEEICSSNSEEMFVTVWLGILDISSGVLRASNAGHEYPIFKRGDSGFELFRDKHGFVIGGMSGMSYSEYSLQLSPGDMVYVYTDGVAEASDKDNELFGLDRLLDVLNSDLSRDPKGQVMAVSAGIEAFAEGVPQFDDITMLCLKYYGKEVRPMKEMSIEATLANIPAVTAFVDAELEELGCPMKAQMQIDIAIDELFSNIAQYAYDPDTGPATVRVEVEEDPLAVIISFIDHGKPYDPLAAADPDVTLAPEDRPMGGLGVFLVKQTMDDVSYEYKNGQNILRIKKNM